MFDFIVQTTHAIAFCRLSSDNKELINYFFSKKLKAYNLLLIGLDSTTTNLNNYLFKTYHRGHEKINLGHLIIFHTFFKLNPRLRGR